MSEAPPDIRLWFASSEADRQAAYDVRMRVFVQEQRVPPEEEIDALDEVALHLLASTPAEVVATSRLVSLNESMGLVGRVAVLREWRQQGIADRMLDALETKARELGLNELTLHSQTYITNLYAKHGYTVTSSAYLEAGIEHVTMTKML